VDASKKHKKEGEEEEGEEDEEEYKNMNMYIKTSLINDT